MIPFDASEIANWGDKPEAAPRLPELVQRLIMATCPMPSLIDMPSGSSVSGPGWDGVLDVHEGNAWAPKGASAWEFSVRNGVKNKANADYDKRTVNPGEVAPSRTSFVFVTPRKWNGKKEWAAKKRNEGQWADVRALDADDLVAWLGAAPEVAEWFAEIIGKLPASGWDSLGEWWTRWISGTAPLITPALVLAGRGEAVGALRNWASEEPASYYLQGATRSEAIAFLAACAHADPDALGSALRERAVVVKTLEAWRSLENHYAALALIRDFEGEAVAQTAVSKGHRVFTPLGAQEDPKGNGCKLPPLLGHDETPQALMEMGLSEAQARAHTRKSARRLLVLRRRLIDEAGGSPPEWVAQASNVAPLALVGKWDGDKEADREFVAKVAGQPYGEVERVVQELSNVPDAPFARIGGRWTFVSPEEAWHLLAPSITRLAMERFIEVAVELLRTASPRFELPAEERYMANIVGKAPLHSDALRSGVAQGLALMSVYPDRVKSVDDAQRRAEYVVSRTLNEHTVWQVWATLGDDLRTLAEAAPNAFLNAVESCLSRSPSPFEALFAQESDGVFGEAAHPGLLWALETLAWSEEHFSRAAKTLARLAEIDPGGRLSNRPSESLSSLFLPWKKFTETPDGRRIETLAMLLQATPQVGWQALLNAYPSAGQGVLERDSPQWRPWAQDGTPAVTNAECAAFVTAMERLVLENIGTNAERWAGLVDAIGRFSPEFRRRATGMLSERIDVVKQRHSSDLLWEKIRRLLNHHRSAMGPGDLKPLDEAYHALTPSDPVKAYAWLFNQETDSPEAGLPDPAPVRVGHAMEDYQANRKLLEEERRKAVRQAYGQGGDSAVRGIAELADYPGSVGLAVASSLDEEAAFALAAPFLGSPEERMSLFARGVFHGLFGQSGWPPLDRALTQIKQGDFQASALGDVYLSAPVHPNTWERLAQEAQEVQNVYWGNDYWGSVNARRAMMAIDIDGFAFAVDQLIAADRAANAVSPAAMRENVPASSIVKILERAPQGESYDIARLLDKLDASADVTDEDIARLEVPYLYALHGERSMKIHQEVLKSPGLFADLIARVFKRSDGQIEGEVDDQARQYRARLSFHILSDLHGVPGMMDDGSVDSESLEAWVSESRRLCKASDREVIGDQQIGQILANAPPGTDGIWPCEPVRDLLDKITSLHLGRGFAIGKRNLRGVTTRGMFDGGAQETSLAEKHREYARVIAARWPFTAKLLGELADSYDSESQWWDNEANWLDHGV